MAYFTAGILARANSSGKAQLSSLCGVMPCSLQAAACVLDSQAPKRLWENCGKERCEAGNRPEGKYSRARTVEKHLTVFATE